MGIQVQGCGLVLLLVLLFFFVRQKRVGLYTERIFFITLMIAIGCLSLDIFTIYAIKARAYIPQILLDFICKSYLVSLVWMGYRALVYVLCDISREAVLQKCIRVTKVVLMIGSIVIYCIPIYYHTDANFIYTYGPSVILTYLFALPFVVATIIITVKSKRVIARRKIAVNVWLAFWLAAAIIQFLNNRFLLVGYGISLGMVVLFVAFENPESNIDRSYGCFHAHALTRYLDECYSTGRKLSIMFLSMASEYEEYMERTRMDQALLEIIGFLQKKKNVKVFKLMDQDLVAVFEDMSQMNSAFQEIQDYFYRKQFYPDADPVTLDFDFPKSVFVLVPDSLVIKNSAELMILFQYQKTNCSNELRTQVCYANELLLEEIREKAETKKEILQAIDEDRIEVFYQPIYSTKKKKYLSAEALVRIRKEDGTMLSPGMFIPVAEETGLIKQVGEIVFEKVCECLSEKKVQQLGIEYIEVNMSVVQFELRNLAERYIKIMKRHDVDPKYINLEITETGSIQAKQNMLENMHRLIKYGVSFSLDDFGNGQSNLDYMIDMPVKIVKLDMLMTQSYFKNIKAKSVVQAVTNMVHNMQLKMVAEGVETKEQLDEMERLGIEYIQGYFFSKPVDKEEFMSFLSKNFEKSV